MSLEVNVVIHCAHCMTSASFEGTNLEEAKEHFSRHLWLIRMAGVPERRFEMHVCPQCARSSYREEFQSLRAKLEKAEA